MCDMNLARVKENGGLTVPQPESFDNSAMRGSMQEILAENLGHFVICEFQIGTQAMAKKEGILYAVGRGFVTLYEENAQTFVVCDVFSVKFVTFYMPGLRPGRGGGSAAAIPSVTVPGADGAMLPPGNYGAGRGAPPRDGMAATGSRTMGTR